jgi:hypothetical protein
MSGTAEEVEETAKRIKALKWTREAGTAQDCGSVMPDLILGIKTQSMKFTPAKSSYWVCLDVRGY